MECLNRDRNRIVAQVVLPGTSIDRSWSKWLDCSGYEKRVEGNLPLSCWVFLLCGSCPRQLPQGYFCKSGGIHFTGSVEKLLRCNNQPPLNGAILLILRDGQSIRSIALSTFLIPPLSVKRVKKYTVLEYHPEATGYRTSKSILPRGGQRAAC